MKRANGISRIGTSGFVRVPSPRQLLTVVIVPVLLLMLWLVYDVIANSDDFEVQTTEFNTQGALNTPIKIAFLSDLHIRNSTSQFEKLELIINTVQELRPDVILLGGDFTGEDAATTRMFRTELLSDLGRFTGVAPTYAVLGNHEWWTANDWRRAISDEGIQVIEGRQKTLRFDQGVICLRGLGDAYTGHFTPQPFEPGCRGVRITLTHDPEAIERDDQSGLYLAGHTHCGQIRLPLIGAPWAPTSASEEYQCGIGSNANKVWLVSAGLGTSIIDVRLGTTATIEFITLK
ncbi:MAG: metallophosphoesterase [Gammaproteobacteria bacterium]|nr:metallophosphoesterase [Gammaproteobacteria bacterium]